MLVVTRRKNESVTILCGNEKVKIMITGVERGAVKLGFIADQKVKIVRSEIVGKSFKEAKHGMVEM